MRTLNHLMQADRTMRSIAYLPFADNSKRFELRSATTVMEIIISLFLLATLAVLSGQIIASVVQTRVEQRKRAWALQEAGNAMEKAFLVPWAELEPGQRREWPCSEAAKRILKDARTTILTEATDDNNVRRLVVRVEWSPGRGQTTQQIQLVAFRHHPQRSEKVAVATQMLGNDAGASGNAE